MEKDRIRNLLRDEELARRDFMRPQLLELGLTVGQGQPRILLNLLRYGPQTQKKLSDRCRMDVTTMSRTLDRMETSGFVAREDTPGCRRSYLIRLTSLGEEKAEKVKGLFEQCDEIMSRGISPEEAEAFCATLEKIAANLLEAGAAREGAAGSGDGAESQ